MLRTRIPKLALEEVFDKKKEIAEALEEEVAEAMAPYGYEVMRALVVDVEPEEAVRRAMGESAPRPTGRWRSGRRAPGAPRPTPRPRASPASAPPPPPGRRRRAQGLRRRVLRRRPGRHAQGGHGHGARRAVLGHREEIAAASASGCSAAAAVPFLRTARRGARRSGADTRRAPGRAASCRRRRRKRRRRWPSIAIASRQRLRRYHRRAVVELSWVALLCQCVMMPMVTANLATIYAVLDVLCTSDLDQEKCHEVLLLFFLQLNCFCKDART